MMGFNSQVKKAEMPDEQNVPKIPKMQIHQ